MSWTLWYILSPLPFCLHSQEFLFFRSQFFNSPVASIILIFYLSVSKLWYNLFYIIRVFISRIFTCFLFLCATPILIDSSCILLSVISNFLVFLQHPFAILYPNSNKSRLYRSVYEFAFVLFCCLILLILTLPLHVF